MRLVGLSLVSGVCLLAASAATAGELRLTDAQMDEVVAGNTLVPWAPMLNTPLVGFAAQQLKLGLAGQYEAKEGESPRNNPTMVLILLGLNQIAMDRLTPP